MARLLLVIALLAVTTSEPSTAQIGSLAGVDSVYATIIIELDDDLGLNQKMLRSRLLTVFQLELRKYGVPISADPHNYLTITLVALEATLEDGRMLGAAYAYRIAFDEYVDVRWRNHFGRATTWESGGGVGMTSMDGIKKTLEEKVVELAQRFVNQWLADNPK